MEQVFDADLLVEQDVKAPGTEEVTARVKNKSGNEVDRINVLEGCNDIPQINLGEKNSDKNDCNEDCQYFCQMFGVHNFPDLP